MENGILYVASYSMYALQHQYLTYIDPLSVVSHSEILIDSIFINLTDDCHVRDSILRGGTCSNTSLP